MVLKIRKTAHIRTDLSFLFEKEKFVDHLNPLSNSNRKIVSDEWKVAKLLFSPRYFSEHQMR